jgi:phosphonate transport system permease protein
MSAEARPLALPAPSAQARALGGRPSRGRRRALGAVVAAIAAALAVALAGGGALVNPAGVAQLGDFFAAALHSRLDAPFVSLTADATLVTLAYAALGTALSLLLGAVGGVLCSETWWRAGAAPARSGRRRGGWLLARMALALPRGVHEVVWALVLLAVFGLDPLVAVLAIGLPFGAVTAKVFSELLDEADPAAFDALRACGASRGAALLYGLLPNALPDLVTYGFYRFECSIRAAAVLGIVGAGGLGFQLALSFQELRYGEMWTLLYALIALSGLADLWSARVRARRLRGVRSGARARRDPFLSGSALAGVALVAWSAWWIGLSAAPLLDGRPLGRLGAIVRDALPPAFGAVGAGELARLALETLAMSVLAAAFAGILGIAFACAGADLARLTGAGGDGPVAGAARLLRRALVRLLLLVLRAIPLPVWALLCLFVLYPGTLPGAFALGLYTLGVVGRLDTEAIDNQDPRPARALGALGAHRGQVLACAVVPLAASRFAAFALYRWEVAIRDTVVVGAVGAGGLGELLRQQLSTFDYGGACAVLLVLVGLALLVDVASASLRRALR